MSWATDKGEWAGVHCPVWEGRGAAQRGPLFRRGDQGHQDGDRLPGRSDRGHPPRHDGWATSSPVTRGRSPRTTSGSPRSRSSSSRRGALALSDPKVTGYFRRGDYLGELQMKVIPKKSEPPQRSGGRRGRHAPRRSDAAGPPAAAPGPPGGRGRSSAASTTPSSRAPACRSRRSASTSRATTSGAIDWNVTARMGQPFIKRFVEERELTVMLAVDVSGSQRSGPASSRSGRWPPRWPRCLRSAPQQQRPRRPLAVQRQGRAVHGRRNRWSGTYNPQAEDVHLLKLDALLTRFDAGLAAEGRSRSPRVLAGGVGNAGHAEAVRRGLALLPARRCPSSSAQAHVRAEGAGARQEDLAGRWSSYCENRL